MPTSATGCYSAPATKAVRGFTLIELLVVIVILGVLSVAATISISPDPRRAAAADVERLALLLETATVEAQAGGRQLAWSTQDDGYAFWEMGDQRAQRWQPLNEDDRFRARHLSEGLHIERVEIDGRTLPAEGLLVFRRGDPPLFRIVLVTPKAANEPSGIVELRGMASGRVEIMTPGAS